VLGSRLKTCCLLHVELTRNFETIYYCQQLTGVKSRRYNIRPDLDEGMEPEVKGYVYKETMAGFFRAWKLNEIHLGLAAKVNEMLVAEINQIIKKTGVEKNECLKILEECVVMGLLSENKLSFKDEDDIHLYMVDTGGMFAFEEAGIPYNKVKFTISIDQRLKIYRRNIFLVENNMTEKEAANLRFFEDTLGKPNNEKYSRATLLVDMKIADKLGVKEYVYDEFKRIANNNNVKIYDLSAKKYLDK